MSTDLVEQPAAQTAILYAVTKETIAKRRAELLALRINGVGDQAGLAVVKAKLKEVVGWRTSVEATRKELKAPHIAAGEEIDNMAKAIQAEIAPIEKHLANQKKLVDDELARFEQEKQRQILDLRVLRLTKGGVKSIDRTYIQTLTEPAFEVYLENQVQIAEQQRAADEERRRQAEETRKAQEKLDADRVELKRQQDEVERQRIANEQAARQLNERRVERELDAQLAERRAAEKEPLFTPVEQEHPCIRTREKSVAFNLLEEFAVRLRLLPVPKVGNDEIEASINELLVECSDKIILVAQGVA